MSDVYSKNKRSSVMKSVKSGDTKPELLLRGILHRCGLRYRLHRRDLPGTPDIVLPGFSTTIFVHGCFWHQHPNCKHAVRPASNVDYWNAKLDGNIERDRINVRTLLEAGWNVLIVWECEMRDIPAVLERILDHLIEK